MALKRPFPAYRGPEKHVFVYYAHANAATVYPEITSLHCKGDAEGVKKQFGRDESSRVRIYR